MEKPYAELSDQDLARAIAGNHAAIQNCWTQVSVLAGGKGSELIASHVKDIEKLEKENAALREEWLRELQEKLGQASQAGREEITNAMKAIGCTAPATARSAEQ